MKTNWHKLGPAWVRDEDIVRVEFYDATDAGTVDAARAMIHVKPLPGLERTCFDARVKDIGPLLDRLEGKGQRQAVPHVGDDDLARTKELLARKEEMYHLANEGWVLATEMCHQKDARIAGLEREVRDLRELLGNGRREEVNLGVG